MENGISTEPVRENAVSAENSLKGTALENICGRSADYKQPMYRIAAAACSIWYRLLYGIHTEGMENIPASGGCILASNHMSLLDPPLLAVACRKRQVHFVAKKELFQTPGLGFILARCGCMWVDRASKDGKAVNQAIDMLKGGRLVGIFPEGTRSKDGKLSKGRLGAAVMALKSGSPVVPACIFNTLEAGRKNGLPCRIGLDVRFGKPIPVELNENPSPSDMRTLCNLIMQKIAELQALGPIKK